MARRSENIFSNLLFKELQATPETIEDVNLGKKQHSSEAPMQFSHLDNETHKNSSAIIIKQEPISVKEEETVQVDELVDTESADTHISEECIKSQLKFEEDSDYDNYFIEKSADMDIVQLNLVRDTDKLDSDQEQSKNQKVEVHPDKSKTFCCDICSKMFLSHTKEQQCITFDKKLSDIHFKSPKKLDTGNKPHACSICNKQFNLKKNLVTHMRVHTGVKPYACSICDKQFNQNSHLVTHMRIHTGVKPYACSICDKKFNRKSNLETHMRIHTGEKPYACSKCNKQFSHKSALVTHMRIHTAVNPYACNICNKQFKHKSTLVRHLKIH